MMEKTIIHTDQAPQAIGPYSQAVKFGNLIFLSGQIPLDPQTGQLIEGEIVAQTEQVLINLHAVLQAAASNLDRVLKTTIYLIDMNDFVAVNEVYGRFFKQLPPARATVAVASLPRGARIEIDAIAY
jgi:2-iminobutanoate/2-iminopropanoate deaminase